MAIIIMAMVCGVGYVCSVHYYELEKKPSKCDVLIKERHNLYLSDVVGDDTKAMLLPHLDSAIYCNCK